MPGGIDPAVVGGNAAVVACVNVFAACPPVDALRLHPVTRAASVLTVVIEVVWKREVSLQRVRIISRSADILLSAESRRSRIISGANFHLIFTSIPIIQLKMNFVNE